MTKEEYEQVPVRDPGPKFNPLEWWRCSICDHMHNILAAERYDGKCCDDCPGKKKP